MKFGIIGNIAKYELPAVVEQLVAILTRTNSDYVVDDAIITRLGESGKALRPARCASREECVKNVDMVIAVGGDGTMLAAARTVGQHQVPILGINLGRLGFLAELAPGEIEAAIFEILEGKYVIEDRMVLEAASQQLPNKLLFGLNDIVVDKSRSSRVIEIEAYVNGDYVVTYRGDGVIISTPTGSTAYALSNGGPIITPMSQVIGLTPIAPHTLSGRPLVIPDSDAIRIVASATSQEVLVSADGQEEALLVPPVELHIRKAAHKVRLVKRVNRTYFDLLSTKLMWGKDVRS